MDISSTLIGLGLLFLFIGPIIFLFYSQNRKHAKRNKLLNQKAEEFGIKPDVTELSPTLLLGLDSEQKKLLVIPPVNNEHSYTVSLTDLASCEVKIVDIKDLPGKVNFITLALTYKKNKLEPVKIIFYDEEEDANPEAEVQLQLAKKWENIINRKYV